MGKFSKQISKRIEHTRIYAGYCLICGDHGPLSFDHVPPKCGITLTKTEQLHITEVFGMEVSNLKGITSMNGSRFRTICRKCNEGPLGQNDIAIADLYKRLKSQIESYFKFANSPYTTITSDVDSLKFARAMIGHILSATSVEECKNPPEHSPYFQPLRDFVLGDDAAINETHDIYYWFYPFNRHLSAKCVGFFNNGHTAILSLLSFFPLAFMVTKKNEGIYPNHAMKLSLSDTALTLNLAAEGVKFAEFPFHGLEGNQFIALTDFQTIVSYPVGR